MAEKWRHSDKDFTFEELADAIEGFVRMDIPWDPMDTEDMTDNLLIRKELPE